jgi:hypothetical protein
MQQCYVLMLVLGVAAGCFVRAGSRTAADGPQFVLSEVRNWPVLLVAGSSVRRCVLSLSFESQRSGFCWVANPAAGCLCGRSKDSCPVECSMFGMQVVLLDGMCTSLIALCSRHALHAAAEARSQLS